VGKMTEGTDSTSTEKNNSEIVVYPAAALFNARETFFNSALVDSLENLGYKTNFPQRDGFEFGNLREAFKDKLPENEINSAVLNVIYYLDMGILLPESDVILANLDEPLDEGVVVEASYAKLMGKFVIGLRTDIRTPYGSGGDDFGAMHFFPAYQCHKFISHYMPCRIPLESKMQMDSLAIMIHETIQKTKISHHDTITHYARFNPNFSMILFGAEILFSKINDIHSKEGLELIASRYIKHKKRLNEIAPQVSI
jgi:nucleoside 2-deoxyribosyltransferase